MRQAEEVSQKLQGQIKRRIYIGNLPLQLTASMGVAMFLDACRDPHELLRVADAAMYHAKSRGKNTLQVFNEGRDAHFGRFLAVETGGFGVRGLHGQGPGHLRAQTFFPRKKRLVSINYATGVAV